MLVMLRGLGQADDSPITKTAAWLATTTAVLMKEPVLAELLQDPYASAFAEAVSPVASEQLAELDDPARRYAWIGEAEAAVPASVGTSLYRKFWFRERVQEALEERAEQLVILGAGCDTLSVRLAEQGLKPTIFELDRPAVADFRADVLAKVAVDLPHVRQVSVDFDREDFRTVLERSGYDSGKPTVVVAEGLLGYLTARAVDDIFEFARAADGGRGTIVFSFIEDLGNESTTSGSNPPRMVDEQHRFAVSPAEMGRWLAERGFALRTLTTARDIEEDFMGKISYPNGHPRLGVARYMHMAVASGSVLVVDGRTFV